MFKVVTKAKFILALPTALLCCLSVLYVAPAQSLLAWGHWC